MVIDHTLPHTRPGRIPAERAMPPMAEVCEQLEKTLVGLEGEIDNLSSRLSPLCTMAPSNPVPEEGRGGANGTIVNSLWVQVSKVERLRRNVRELLNALDV